MPQYMTAGVQLRFTKTEWLKIEKLRLEGGWETTAECIEQCVRVRLRGQKRTNHKDLQALMASFWFHYQKVHNAKPTWSHALRQSCNTLLKEHGLDRCLEVVDYFFRHSGLDKQFLNSYELWGRFDHWQALCDEEKKYS